MRFGRRSLRSAHRIARLSDKTQILRLNGAFLFIYLLYIFFLTPELANVYFANALPYALLIPLFLQNVVGFIADMASMSVTPHRNTSRYIVFATALIGEFIYAVGCIGELGGFTFPNPQIPLGAVFVGGALGVFGIPFLFESISYGAVALHLRKQTQREAYTFYRNKSIQHLKTAAGLFISCTGLLGEALLQNQIAIITMGSFGLVGVLMGHYDVLKGFYFVFCTHPPQPQVIQQIKALLQLDADFDFLLTKGSGSVPAFLKRFTKQPPTKAQLETARKEIQELLHPSVSNAGGSHMILIQSPSTPSVQDLMKVLEKAPLQLLFSQEHMDNFSPKAVAILQCLEEQFGSQLHNTYEPY